MRTAGPSSSAACCCASRCSSPLLLVAPAHAVVNGQPLKPSKAPWFVPAGICGATLIAPDRLATAAHCVDPVDLGDFETIKVGGETRRGVAVALPSTWREQSAGFARDDVAIIKLDRPVTRVAPVPLATKVPAKVRILGQGKRAWDAPTGRDRAASGHAHHDRRPRLRPQVEGHEVRQALRGGIRGVRRRPRLRVRG